MLKGILGIVFLSTTLYSNEFSVYNFENEKPQNEAIQESKSSFMVQEEPTTPTTLWGLQQKVIELEERVAGLTSVVEGLNRKIAELENPYKKASTPAQGSDAVLDKLAKMIDKINREYVSKDELAKVLNSDIPPVNTKKEKPTASTAPIKNLTPKELYRRGTRAYIDKEYTTAIQYFKATSDKNYKPAASNFNLGEIAYYSKKYEEAIFYYKKSAGLNDKASYIDTLLLHTAIALDNTGKKEQAKAFYDNVITNYEGKKTAEIAKRRLEKL
jgi:TolA-binding protein